MLWQYFVNDTTINFKDLKIHKDSKIIHHGGWKKIKEFKYRKK